MLIIGYRLAIGHWRLQITDWRLAIIDCRLGENLEAFKNTKTPCGYPARYQVKSGEKSLFHLAMLFKISSFPSPVLLLLTTQGGNGSQNSASLRS